MFFEWTGKLSRTDHCEWIFSPSRSSYGTTESFVDFFSVLNLDAEALRNVQNGVQRWKKPEMFGISDSHTSISSQNYYEARRLTTYVTSLGSIYFFVHTSETNSMTFLKQT